MEKPKPSVLIVGAGPTGLCLALALVKNGVPVRIIEKDTSRMSGEKGNGIVPRSLELHHFLGTINDILNNSSEIPLTRFYKKDVVVREFYFHEHIDPQPTVPYPNTLLMGQYMQETIFRSHLERLGCFVEQRMALMAFEQNSDRVLATLQKTLEDGTTTTEECEFKWLVGADGSRSTVRKTLGLAFLGEAIAEHFLVGDMYITSGLRRDRWNRWGDMDTMLLSIDPAGAPSDETFRFIVRSKHIDFEQLKKDPEELSRCMNEVIDNPEIKLGKILFISHYQPQIRMVDKLSEDRVFVAGDAAHVHSPAGGQGLNSGLMDAVNLAWKIAFVERGYASSHILESYNHERYPVISEMLNITTSLFKKISAEGVGSKRGKEFTQLTVNYRWSSIIVDDNETTSESDAYGSNGIDGLLRAGDRAPDALGLVDSKTGKTARLFDLYGVDHHVVLCFGGKVDIAVPNALFKVFAILPPQSTTEADDDYVLIDNEGHALEAFRTAGCKIIIIRPDGVIGAMVKDAEGVHRYLEAIHLLDL